jgi:hypothetical protein
MADHWPGSDAAPCAMANISATVRSSVVKPPVPKSRKGAHSAAIPIWRLPCELRRRHVINDQQQAPRMGRYKPRRADTNSTARSGCADGRSGWYPDRSRPPCRQSHDRGRVRRLAHRARAQVVQAERLERRAEAMHIIFGTKLAQQQPHGLTVKTPTCRAAGEHEISWRTVGTDVVEDGHRFVRWWDDARETPLHPVPCHWLPVISIQRILKTSAARGAPQTISISRHCDGCAPPNGVPIPPR